MKYIIYRRVSTQRQGRSGLGLEAQQAEADRYLAAHEGEVIATFQDVESGKHNNRPGLDEAIALQRKTGARILIAKLDRLSRNAAFLLMLRDSGVDFVACDCPQANTMTIGVMALLAQQEREFISSRTKQALAAKRARVEAGTDTWNHGDKSHAFGDGNGEACRARAIQNAQTRADKLSTLLRAFKAQGMTLRQIATELNNMDIKTARGGSWHASSVKNYLDRV